MSTCPTCHGKKTVQRMVKTIAGMKMREAMCHDCYGSGKKVNRFTYKGLEVVEVEPNEVTVVDLRSDFCSVKQAKAVIDSVEKEMNEINADMDEDEKFPNLKEYCEDYLAECDPTPYYG